jgi:hypothetical protein
MAADIQVEFRDTGLTQVRDILRRLNELSLTIGFQGESGGQLYPTGANVSTVALYQEFGTKTIPQRAFLRSTMFERRDAVERIMGDAIGEAITQASTSISPAIGALSRAGAKIVRLVERKIDTSTGWAKANAPSTVAKKGFDYALHETDLMARSVTWAVRRGSTILASGGS